jgi:hypothetical protein
LAVVRIIGGLLSAHQMAVHANLQIVTYIDSDLTRANIHAEPLYDGKFLLDLAVDIGNRLLPAFKTKTGVDIYMCIDVFY